MFDKLDDKFSHMPFIGTSMSNGDKQLCCLKINDVWKIHYFDNGIYRKLATYTRKDAIECSPTCEWRPDDNIWAISFIAGGSVEDDWKDVDFWLYLKRGFDDTEPVKICPANYGYIQKHKLVYGDKFAPIIYCIEDGLKTTIHLKDIDYIYRISYDINDPDIMFISAQRKNGDLVSFSYRLHDDYLYVITDNQEPCYKMCTGVDEEIYYCRKGLTNDFEDRHIVKANKVIKKRHGRKLFVEKIEVESTDYVTENFKEY